MEQARWTIDDYTIASGENPVRTFLSVLQDRDKVEAFALIQLLSERGNTLRLPHSRSLGVSQPAIAKLESGRAKNIELRTLVRAVSALGGTVKIQITPGAKGKPRGVKKRSVRNAA